MKTPESWVRRSPLVWAVVLGVGVGLLGLAPVAEATRTMPSAVTVAFEPEPPAIDLLTEPEIPDETFAVFDEADLSHGCLEPLLL